MNVIMLCIYLTFKYRSNSNFCFLELYEETTSYTFLVLIQLSTYSSFKMVKKLIKKYVLGFANIKNRNLLFKKFK